MKNLIFSMFIFFLTLNLSAQKEYLSLTPIRSKRNIVNIPEGKMVRIRFLNHVHRPVRGNLEILNNTFITVRGDTIVLNNIKKIILRNFESSISGGVLVAGGMGLTVVGATLLSSITLSEEVFIFIFQLMGGLLLAGVVTYGVIFTAVGVTTLIRGKAYKTYGNRGYNLRVVNDRQETDTHYSPI